MPTIRRCCIVGCLSNSRQNPQLQFFQFPRPENPFHKIWKQACHASLSRILPFKKPFVCALHFRPNCIAGRRLISSAVPSLRLEVPQNLKAVEQQAMIEEIERSRKCAYINAVVYEWLVRANLNPQLRGSITHGMIKEKAESARQIIGSTIFMADNRWLNRFRETHLTGFAQKLSSNQLKPVGSSLWIPDIVQDLQHMFPPTNADRISLENVPEQYYDYMQQQYGEYEEDEDADQKSNSSNSMHESNMMSNQYMQQDQQQKQQSPHTFNNYDSYGHHMVYAGGGAASGGGYDDYSYYQQQERQQQQQQQQQQQPLQQQPYQQPQQAQQQAQLNSYHHTPSPHTPPIGSPNQQTNQPNSRSPHQQPQTTSPTPNDTSGAATAATGISLTRKHSESPNQSKRVRYDDGVKDENKERGDATESSELKQKDNGSEASRRSSSSSDNDNDNENSGNENANSNGNEDRNGSNETSAPSSPLNSLGQNGNTIRPIHISKLTQPRPNGNTSSTALTNGHVTPSSTPTPNGKTNGNGIDSDQMMRSKRVELRNYSQALEYLKPLEDFVLFKENFRAIGIISHLETVLRKAKNRSSQPEISEEN